MQKTLLAVAMLISLTAGAQSAKYTETMTKNIALLDSAKTVDQLQSLAGTFDRIGNAEKTQWLPYYYAALAQTWIGWMPARAAGPSGATLRVAITLPTGAIDPITVADQGGLFMLEQAGEFLIKLRPDFK